jgi:hypothetical protein
MSKELTFKELSQIPADIQKMWGKPPVLSNEDLEAYNDLALAIANSVKPPDIIAWLYVAGWSSGLQAAIRCSFRPPIGVWRTCWHYLAPCLRTRLSGAASVSVNLISVRRVGQ